MDVLLISKMDTSRYDTHLIKSNSLPPEVLETLKDIKIMSDTRALYLKHGSSAFVSLAEYKKHRRNKRMGYRAMAAENLRLAEEALPLVTEILEPWKENDETT